ncbi:MAG: hypothetical protein KDE53_37255, partial [Caldilineaceae bacterium]|nr:hypothetical protein [Caldilineaceae bacterium]
DLEMTACDLYNHCTTVEPTPALAAPPAAAGAEVLSPASGAVLTTTAPVTVSGDVYAQNGLQTLTVLVNGSPTHMQAWETAQVTDDEWRFTWTPLGEGIYRFVPLIDDWVGETPPEVTAQADLVPDSTDTARPTAPAQPVPTQLAQRIHLPFVAVEASSSGGLSTDGRIYLPLVATGGVPAGGSGVYTGTLATIYVDPTPPAVNIQSTVPATVPGFSRGTIQLTGTASDAVQLHQVDVRIGDGPWWRAGFSTD